MEREEIKKLIDMLEMQLKVIKGEASAEVKHENITIGEFEGETIEKAVAMVWTFRIEYDSAPGGVLVQSKDGRFFTMMNDGSVRPVEAKP